MPRPIDVSPDVLAAERDSLKPRRMTVAEELQAVAAVLRGSSVWAVSRQMDRSSSTIKRAYERHVGPVPHHKRGFPAGTRVRELTASEITRVQLLRAAGTGVFRIRTITGLPWSRVRAVVRDFDCSR